MTYTSNNTNMNKQALKLILSGLQGSFIKDNKIILPKGKTFVIKGKDGLGIRIQVV